MNMPACARAFFLPRILKKSWERGCTSTSTSTTLTRSSTPSTGTRENEKSEGTEANVLEEDQDQENIYTISKENFRLMRSS